MRSELGIVMLFLCGVACGDDVQTVEVDWQVEFVASGNVVVPLDLRNTELQVYALRAGSLRRYPETPTHGSEYGTAHINVSGDSGELLLKASRGGQVTWYQLEDYQSVRRIKVLGRPGAVEANASTLLELNVTGLSPWQPADALVAHCWSTSTESYIPTNALGVRAGDTELHGTYDWAGPSTFSHGPGTRPYLLDASAEDQLTISRISVEPFPNGMTSTLIESGVISGIAQQTGTMSVAAVALTSVDVQKSHRFAWAPQSASVPDLAGYMPRYLEMGLYTGPGARNLLVSGPVLVGLESDAQSPVDLSLQYGNPFDAAWPVIAASTLYLSPPVTLPGSRKLGDAWNYLSSVRQLQVNAPESVFALPPLLRWITVDGRPADDAFLAFPGNGSFVFDTGQQQVGRWVLEVFRVVDDGGAELNLEHVTMIAATRPQVRVPAEIFATDNYYVFRLTRVTETNEGRAGASLLTPKLRVAGSHFSYCGDGVVDPARGEVCDDGNTVDGDACSTTCS